jgi:hypothetical protein
VPILYSFRYVSILLINSGSLFLRRFYNVEMSRFSLLFVVIRVYVGLN